MILLQKSIFAELFYLLPGRTISLPDSQIWVSLPSHYLPLSHFLPLSLPSYYWPHQSRSHALLHLLCRVDPPILHYHAPAKFAFSASSCIDKWCGQFFRHCLKRKGSPSLDKRVHIQAAKVFPGNILHLMSSRGGPVCHLQAG